MRAKQSWFLRNSARAAAAAPPQHWAGGAVSVLRNSETWSGQRYKNTIVTSTSMSGSRPAYNILLLDS